MWKQQEANAHGQPQQGQPLLCKQLGPAARQGYGLPPVQATHAVWKHLGHSETEVLNKAQVGHGGSACRDLFTGLSPYMRGNRSTLRASKWISSHQEAQGTWWPAKQTVWHKRLCPKNEAALVDRLHKKREELGRLEDKVHAEKFRATYSLYKKESPMIFRSILRDPPSPILKPAAGHWERHNTSCVTKAVTKETPKDSELVSLDQLLAELCPVSDDSLSCHAPVKELPKNWEQEQLPDREAAGQRDREPESALFLSRQDKGGRVLRDTSSVTPELAAGSQGLCSTLGVTRDSAGETGNNTETAPLDQLAHGRSASGNEPSCDALLKELLEKWEKGKLLGRAWAGEGDSEAESSLSLTPGEEDEEPEPSTPDSDPCGKGHSEPLPRALPHEPQGFEGCASPANEAAAMEAGRAQAAPPQEKPRGCCGVM